MPTSVKLELVRQLLRLVGFVLVQVPFMPDSFVGLTDDEDVIMWVSGLLSYALAETGWLTVKAKALWAWYNSRNGRN